MQVRPKMKERAASRAAALGLALWLTGVGCLFGCEMKVSAASDGGDGAQTQTVSMHAAAHGCCHAKTANSSRKSDPAHAASLNPSRHAGGEMRPCPFASPAAESAGKVRPVAAHAASAPRARAPESDASPILLSGAHRALVADRGGTYLRCCVFLI
jgi:hypothetical protein